MERSIKSLRYRYVVGFWVYYVLFWTDAFADRWQQPMSLSGGDTEQALLIVLIAATWVSALWWYWYGHSLFVVLGHGVSSWIWPATPFLIPRMGLNYIWHRTLVNAVGLWQVWRLGIEMQERYGDLEIGCAHARLLSAHEHRKHSPKHIVVEDAPQPSARLLDTQTSYLDGSYYGLVSKLLSAFFAIHSPTDFRTILSGYSLAEVTDPATIALLRGPFPPAGDERWYRARCTEGPCMVEVSIMGSELANLRIQIHLGGGHPGRSSAETFLRTRFHKQMLTLIGEERIKWAPRMRRYCCPNYDGILVTYGTVPGHESVSIHITNVRHLSASELLMAQQYATGGYRNNYARLRPPWLDCRRRAKSAVLAFSLRANLIGFTACTHRARRFTMGRIILEVR